MKPISRFGGFIPELVGIVVLLLPWELMIAFIAIRKGRSGPFWFLIAILPVISLAVFTFAQSSLGDAGVGYTVFTIIVLVVAGVALELGVLAPLWILSVTDAEVKRDIAELKTLLGKRETSGAGAGGSGEGENR
jgi:hypothetical protein